MTHLRSSGTTRDADDPERFLTGAHADLRWMHRHWSQQRRDGHPPARAGLDPLDMPQLLPMICLLEVTPDSDVRMRLAGAAMRELFGREVAGSRFMELFPDLDVQAAEARAIGEVIAARQPVYRDGPLRWRAEALDLMSQRLYLPISQDGGDSVDLILWISAVFSDDGRLSRARRD